MFFIRYFILFIFLLKIVKSDILLDFGPRIDNVNPKIDDACGEKTQLDTPFDFYGSNYSQFWVCNNGLISFSGSNNEYRPQSFPIDGITMIAPFWADLDNEPGKTDDNFNQVYWRKDSSIGTKRAMSKILHSRSSDRNFSPSWVVVATWYKVGYYERKFDKKNTFQVVLACEDGKYCYSLMSYEQIEWTNSKVQTVDAQAGFNDGKGQFMMLPGSRTPDVKNLVSQSNVDVPGLFIYKLTDKEVQKDIGCSSKIEPEIAHMYFEVQKFYLEGFLCKHEATVDLKIEVIFSGSAQEVKVEGKLSEDKQTIVGNFPFWGRAETATVQVLLNGQQIAEFAKMTFVTCSNYEIRSGKDNNYLSVKLRTISGADSSNNVNEITFTWNPYFFLPSTTEVALHMETVSLVGKNSVPQVTYRHFDVVPNTGSKTYNVELQPGFSFASVDVVQTNQTVQDCWKSASNRGFSIRNCQIDPIIHPDPVSMLPQEVSCKSLIGNEIDFDNSTRTNWRDSVSNTQGCPRNSVNVRGRNDAWFAHAEVRTGSWSYDPCCSGPNKLIFEAFRFCSDCKMNRGADFCIISRAVQFNDFSETNSAEHLRAEKTKTISNQCCYDITGKLLTNSRQGAGTSKRSIPNSANLFEFFEVEYSFFKICCVDEDKCERYREYRYPTIGSYTPRRASINWGDPHIETLDGFKYTFNGIGVFTMIELRKDKESPSNMTVQASMRLVGKGTVFSGVAVADLVTSAELFLTQSGQIIISINGSRLEGFDENTRTVVSDGCLFNEEPPFVNRDSVFLSMMRSGSGRTVQTEFTLRLTESDLVVSAVILSDEEGNKVLNIGVSPPTETRGKLRGLLGNFDGDMSNDLASKLNFTLLLTSDMALIHEHVADTWKVDSDLWLFGIHSRQAISEDIEKAGYYYKPVYETVFDNEQLESQAKQKCGDDKNCLLDVALTGNLQMADNSKQMEELLDVNKELFNVYLETLRSDPQEDPCDFSCLLSTPVVLILNLILVLFASISATVIRFKRKIENAFSREHQMTYSQLKD